MHFDDDFIVLVLIGGFFAMMGAILKGHAE